MIPIGSAEHTDRSTGRTEKPDRIEPTKPDRTYFGLVLGLAFCTNSVFASTFIVQWKSLFFVHLFKVLKNGIDFSADLERNLFRLASFPFNFCTSFRHFGDGKFKTAPTLSGHTIIPLVFTLYPKNVPSSIPKYRPRTSVKGQILADFIVECPKDNPLDTPMEAKEELPDPWTLLTDGSSCVDGSGAGLILKNPEGVEFTYSLRFRFDATNNEAEHEALIVDLRIAEQMGVRNL
nr:reverse transcriptase domain-containing protein [Tanacetum cinerariifolium]